MIKTFLFGIFLGLLAAAGALYALPLVDQHREASIISVAPNGGNVELFQIQIPSDRVLIGRADASEALPEGLEWPTDEFLAGVRTEVFKIRNERDAVVGVASRTTIANADPPTIEWLLHLPARGSMFVAMNFAATEDGFRSGTIRAGSREFEPLSGGLTERWVADESDEPDANLGRIELRAKFVGRAEEVIE